MHKLHELKEKLVDEMEAYADNGKYSKEDVEAIKYMASAVDHICNIMERYDEEEYSGNMMGGSYEGSYARGRNRGGRSYARRGGYSRRGSYAMGGYSRAADNVVQELREVMNEVQDERVRQEINEAIKGIEQM